MRGLYAIIDVDTLTRRGVLPLPFVEAVLETRPAAVQLRDKSRGARATLELLRSMAPLCVRAGVPLFANDRPDLALLARCDGVHLGRDDVPAAVARCLALEGGHAKGSDLRVGLSTHNAVDVEEALLENPDYLAIGPVFPTVSKENPSPVVGVGGLAALVSKVRGARSGLPVVAIGGITFENVSAIGALVDCVAVIGALLPASLEGFSASQILDSVRERARELHSLVLGDTP